MDETQLRVAEKKVANVCPLPKAEQASRAKARLRLRKDRQIRIVLEKGRLFRGKHVLLRMLPANEIKPTIEEKGPFLAVVISRKKAKKAVSRNRMRRQLREVFRLRQSEIPNTLACVLIARHVDKRVSYGELEQDFLNLIQISKA